MRVFIDARMLRRGGTLTYATSLLKSVLKMDLDKNEYSVLYAPGQEQVPDDNATAVVAPSRNPFHWLWWERTGLQRLLRDRRIDLIHCLRRPVATGRNVKNVYTLHSAYTFSHPEFCGFSERFFWSPIYRKHARRADGVLAVSDEDRVNLVKALGLDENKVYLHHLAPPETISRVDDELVIAAVKRRYGIEGPYYLFIGNYYLIKNIPGIVRAYASLKKEVSIPHKLVLVGQPGSASREVRLAIAASGVAEQIIETGGLSDDHELSCLYSGAAAFLLPTHYDSFGLPILEAMACGTPVVASTTGALPEIAGDAALLANPDDIEEIATTMRRLVDDPALRDEMIARGYRRAGEFSWDKCARCTLDVYDAVLNAG